MDYEYVAINSFVSVFLFLSIHVEAICISTNSALKSEKFGYGREQASFNILQLRNEIHFATRFNSDECEKIWRYRGCCEGYEYTFLRMRYALKHNLIVSS